MRGPISFAPVIEQGGFEGGVEQDRGQVLGRSRVLFKEVRVRSNKISRKKCPKLVDRGKRNVQERERETLEELIMRASNVNFNVGTTKQKGAIMPRKFGGPNRQGVKASSLIICCGAIKDR